MPVILHGYADYTGYTDYTAYNDYYPIIRNGDIDLKRKKVLHNTMQYISIFMLGQHFYLQELELTDKCRQ